MCCPDVSLETQSRFSLLWRFPVPLAAWQAGGVWCFETQERKAKHSEENDSANALLQRGESERRIGAGGEVGELALRQISPKYKKITPAQLCGSVPWECPMGASGCAPHVPAHSREGSLRGQTDITVGFLVQLVCTPELLLCCSLLSARRISIYK